MASCTVSITGPVSLGVILSVKSKQKLNHSVIRTLAFPSVAPLDPDDIIELESLVVVPEGLLILNGFKVNTKDKLCWADLVVMQTVPLVSCA